MTPSKTSASYSNQANHQQSGRSNESKNLGTALRPFLVSNSGETFLKKSRSIGYKKKKLFDNVLNCFQLTTVAIMILLADAYHLEKIYQYYLLNLIITMFILLVLNSHTLQCGSANSRSQHEGVKSCTRCRKSISATPYVTKVPPHSSIFCSL